MPRRTALRSSLVAIVALLASTALLGGVPATAGSATASTAPPAVVSAVPATGTPDISDGAVYAATQVGATMVVGGTFTQTASADPQQPYATPYVLAFDAVSGAVSTAFAPGLDGIVYTVLPGPTAGTVYVGGGFRTVDGGAVKSLVLLNVADGSRVTSFAMPPTDGTVQTLKVVNGQLLVGGTFTTVGGAQHGGLVSLDPTTGAVTGYLADDVAVNHNWTPSSPRGAAKGAVGVFRLAVSPDATKLVAIGNFKQVDGATHDQIAMWDLPAGGTATLRNWNTGRLSPACLAATYDSYVRDVAFSPDGSYFSLVNTGGYLQGALCDSASRWETAGTGPDVQPTWVAFTGQDSLLSTAVTGAAVYVGGHQRWLNNALAHDSAGPGAVPRPGLAALDPATGIPLAWNPGRNPRGAGAYTLLKTPAGLWMGSDTPYIGNKTYLRGRIAFFPLAGGQPPASKAVATLPGEVYAGSVPSAAATGVLYRVNAGGPLLQSTDAGPDWTADPGTGGSPVRNRGSVVAAYGSPVPTVDSTVPAGTPTAVFSDERVDPAAAPELAWHFAVPSGTSVEVRLYFADRCTCATTVGSRVFDVSVDGTTRLSHLDVLASAGNQTGTMRSVTVTSDGRVDIAFTPEAGNPTVSAIELVRAGSGPYPSPAGSLAGRTFTGTAAGASQPLTAPLDVANVRGAALVGSTLFYGKTDSGLYSRTTDGRSWGPETVIDPYDDPYWSDVQTGSGNVYRGMKPSFYDEITNLTSMFYDGTGRMYYTLYGLSGLYYRDFSPDSGIIGSTRRAVTGVTLPDVTGAFLAGGSLYYATRADGNLRRVGFDGTTVSGTPTVVSGPMTDGTDWRSRVLYLGAVPPAPSAIAFHGSSSVTGQSATTLAVPVPDGTRAGDALLLKVSTSGTASNPQVPAGWTDVTRQSAGTALTVLWQRTATAQDTPGSIVTVTLANPIKSSTQLLAYGGTGATPVTASAAAADTDPTTTHTAPGAPVATAGSWVVRFWTDKSSATTAWTLPTGTLRASTYGSGAGYLTTIIADDGAEEPAGTAPALVAGTDAASRAAMITVVLAPAAP